MTALGLLTETEKRMNNLSIESSKKLLRYVLALNGTTIETVCGIIGVETEVYVDKLLNDDVVNPRVFQLFTVMASKICDDRSKRLLNCALGSLFTSYQDSEGNVFFQSVFTFKGDYSDVESDMRNILAIPNKFIVLRKYEAYVDFKGYYTEQLNQYIDKMSESELRMLLDKVSKISPL